MKNLTRLTNAANNRDGVVRTVDRRKLPTCADETCKRKTEYLLGGKPTQHCYKHMTNLERIEYLSSWV